MKQRMCFIILLGALLFAPIISVAQIPADYYASATGKKGDALLLELHSIISRNYNSIDYGSLEPYYAKTDLDSTGHIWDMYSLCGFSTDDANCSQKKVCDCWNKEHSIPQSWFNEARPMKSDLFHVVPTDARVNNFRGNMPYGETSTTAKVDGAAKALGHIGTSNFSGYSGKVYEPDDEYKGDFARIYFYMATRYSDKNFTQSGDAGKVFTYSGGRAGLTSYAINLFLKWHRQDPVSKKEINRNNAVYGIQKNRNPFVDYPYMVEYIWGKKTSTSLDFQDLLSSEDELFTPGVSDGSVEGVLPMLRSTTTAIAFPAQMVNTTEEHQFTISGARLSSAISLTLSGANADMFAISPASIPAGSANGYHIFTLTYHPTATGSHTATLTVTSQGANTLTIPLSGVSATEAHITWKVNGQVHTAGSPTTTLAVGSAPTILPMAPKSTCEESEQFVGWSEFEILESTDEVPGDLFSSEEDAPVISNDVAFYAVFAHLSGGGMTELDTTYHFKDIADFEKWSSAYEKHEVDYPNAVYTFEKADKNTGNIEDVPVTKGHDMTYVLKDTTMRIASSTLTLKSYNGKSKTIAVYPGASTPTGVTYSSSSVASSSNFVLTAAALPANTNALKFVCTEHDNQVGVVSLQVKLQKGKGYSYSRFTTVCGEATALETPAAAQRSNHSKYIHNDRLYLRYDNWVYDVTGRKVR